MNEQLEQALEIVRQLPEEDQDRIAQYLLDYADWLERSEKYKSSE